MNFQDNIKKKIVYTGLIITLVSTGLYLSIPDQNNDSQMIIQNENIDDLQSFESQAADNAIVALNIQLTEYKITASDGDDGRAFGERVAISGNKAIVGSFRDDTYGDFAGAAFIFRWDGTNWVEEDKLYEYEAGGSGGHNYGYTVDIDGDHAIVGATTGSGRAYVYKFNGTHWEEVAELRLSGYNSELKFGRSVAISGTKIIVGDPGDYELATGSGAAYIYRWDGNEWIFDTKLISGDPDFLVHRDSGYGGSVDISGDYAIVGARDASVRTGESTGHADRGSAYIYHWDGNEWVETNIISSDGGPGDRFGGSVAIDGNRAIVGAIGTDDFGWGSGSAYIYTRNGANWVQTKLLASDGTGGSGQNYAGGDSFGESVSISGNYALIGAPWNDDDGTSSGSAYIFRWNGANWIEDNKLTASDAAAGDSFGSVVGISFGRSVIGSDNDDDMGPNSGSAYIYDLEIPVVDTIAPEVTVPEDITVETVSIYGAPVTYTASATDNLDGTLPVSCTINSGDMFPVGMNKIDCIATDSDGNSWFATFFVEVIMTEMVEHKVTNLVGAVGEYFGTSVGIDGDVAIVGTRKTDPTGPDSGGAYFYRWDGTDWNNEAKFTSHDGSITDFYGRNIAISGDIALVSASWDGDYGYWGGAVYMYQWDGSNWIEEQKFNSSDLSATDEFGSSLAFDGNRIVVGAAGETSDKGAVYIYDWDGSNWVETKIVASDGSSNHRFGSSVGISGDVIVVGSPRENTNGDYAGAVYIYDWDGTNWVETKILASDGANDDDFGQDVAISGDRAIVSADGDDDLGSNSGSVYVYDWDGTNWVETKLTASDGHWDSKFGSDVSLEGNRAVIGANEDNNIGEEDTGAVYIFDFDGINWVETKLLAHDPDYRDDLGRSVALKGNTIIAGASGDDEIGDNSGAAYIFRKTGTNWDEEVKLMLVGNKITPQFGYSVAIDGELAIVGTPLDDDKGLESGSVVTYRWDGYEWRGFKYSASDGATNDNFGFSVALSVDTAVIGSPFDDDKGHDSGSVYIYNWNGYSWIFDTKLMASDGAIGDHFGHAVAISGDTVIVGACDEDDNGNAAGAVYIYQWDGTSWLETKILASDGIGGDQFGCSVAIDVDTAIVGADGVDDNGVSSGAIYVYQWDGTSWLETKILATDGTADDQFGSSVAVSGDQMIVGAPGDNENGANSGSAYIHSWDGIKWVQSKLIPSEGNVEDYFGHSVSIRNNLVIVGAYGSDANGVNSGAAYLFDTNGLDWSEMKILPNDGKSNDLFGYSVAVGPIAAIVGAMGDINAGSIEGSAYFYNFRERDESTAPPTVLVPSDMILDPNLPTGRTVFFPVSAHDSIDGAVPVSCTPRAGSLFLIGTTTVTCEATDSDGFTGIASFTITIRDDEPPVLIMPIDMTVEATSSAGAVVTFGSPTATDMVDGNIIPICDASSGDIFPLAITTITCIATDSSGNSQVGTFTITVIDTKAPKFKIVDDINVEATSSRGAVAYFITPRAIDIVDGEIVSVCDATSGDTFPIGRTTVTCAATDNEGNTAITEFGIFVVDTTAPDLTVPGNIIAEATSSQGAIVTFAEPTAYDIVDGKITPTCTAKSGDTFPLGKSVIQCLATDNEGNIAGRSFVVLIVDTTSPALSLPADIEIEATSASGAVVTFTVKAVDLVDGSRLVACTAGSGDTFPIGDTIVQCETSDSRGNTAQGSFTVTVFEITPPETTLTVSLKVEQDGNMYVSSSSLFTLSAYDEHSGVDFTEYHIDDGQWILYTDTFSIADAGVYTIYFRSTDNVGNVEEAKSQEVTVDQSELAYTGDLTGVYSDMVTLNATLIDFVTKDPLSGKTIEFVLGTQSTTSVTDMNGFTEVKIKLDQPEGIIPLRVGYVEDGDYLPDVKTYEFRSTKENLFVSYTGTTVSSTTQDEIAIRATVQDENDGSLGDLSLANIRFVIYDMPMTEGEEPDYNYGPYAVVPSSIEGIGIVMVDISNLDEGNYIIFVITDAGDNQFYHASEWSNGVTITIYTPNKDFVAGGGWIEEASGGKGFFGFILKYKKNGDLWGHSLYTYRDGDWQVIVKSHNWYGLGIDGNHAFFEGTSKIIKFNCETKELIILEGEFQFRVDIWDNKWNPDIYQIKILDTNGLFFHEAGFDPLGEVCGWHIKIHQKKIKNKNKKHR